MGLEIEHKYLVKAEAWRKVKPQRSFFLQQAYLLTDPEKTIRVRIQEDKAWITIKGKSQGASRLEFEYEIPVQEAGQLIAHFGTNSIEKIRHHVTYHNKLWEVDEFKGANEGLLVAEIELGSENESYSLPEWTGADVTNDSRYANSNLSLNPYTEW